MFTNLLLYYRVFIYLFKTAKIMLLSYILYELLNVEHGNPISHKKIRLKFCGSFAEEINKKHRTP